MKLKNINSVNLKGKKIVVRIDINATIINNKPQDSLRFKESAETIKQLKEKGAKIVLLAHQGQPGKNNFTSLEKHTKILSKYTKVRFLKKFPFPEDLEEIKNGEAILLENIRFNKDEFSNKKINTISDLFKNFDYYINDAFSVSHRQQTSITGLPRILRGLIGPTFEKELKFSEKIKNNLKDCLFILGGAKPTDIIDLVKNNNVLSTGKLSLLILQAKGYKLGKEDSLLNSYKSLLKKPGLKKAQTPTDLAYNKNGKRQNILIENLPINHPILDIGDETITNYVKEIKRAKVIFFKGPAGLVEDKRFQKGTKKILEAMTKSKAFTIVAGGDSSTFLKKLKINSKKISHISPSGGALIQFIAGKKLPGLEALKN